MHDLFLSLGVEVCIPEAHIVKRCVAKTNINTNKPILTAI